MPDNIEWAHIAQEQAVVVTAVDQYAEDPESRLLAPEIEGWNTGIFIEHVALYADSPQQLLHWLEQVTTAVEALIEREAEKPSTYLVAATGGIEAPSFQSFTDGSKALWRYLELAADLRPGEYGDRVDLLQIIADPQAPQNRVIASTAVED